MAVATKKKAFFLLRDRWILFFVQIFRLSEGTFLMRRRKPLLDEFLCCVLTVAVVHCTQPTRNASQVIEANPLQDIVILK